MNDNFVISPDGHKVAYQSDNATGTGAGSGVNHLFIAQINGSSTIRISQNMASSRDVSNIFAFSHDSAKILFFADHTADNVLNAYVADATKAYDAPGGNSYTMVSLPDHDLYNFEQLQPVTQDKVYSRRNAAFSPDDQYVIVAMSSSNYATDNGDLWRFKVDGTQKIRLSPQVTNLGITKYFDIEPNQNKIVVYGDIERDEVYELYSVNFDGTNWQKLSVPIQIGAGDVSINPQLRLVDWTTRSVVYGIDAFTDSVQEVYSVSVDGGASTRISGSSIDYSDVSGPLWAYNGEHVVYRSNPSASNQFKLFSAQKDGSNEKLLFSPPNASGTVTSFQISPNSLNVVFNYLPGDGLPAELWSSPIDGSSAAYKLTPTFTNAGATFSKFLISPNSQWVAIMVDAEFDEAHELFLSKIDGSEFFKVSANIINAANQDVVSNFTFSPDSQKIAFLQDYIVTANVMDAFISQVAPGSPRICVSNFGTYAGGGALSTFFEFSHDSNTFLFTADLDTNNVTELWSNNLSGTNPIKLSLPVTTTTRHVVAARLSPNSSKIVYQSKDSDPNKTKLTAINFDGSGRTDLTPLISSASTSVFAGTITANNKLIFTMDHDVATKVELYSVNLDGSNFLKLNAPMNDESDVVYSQVNPNRTKVTYRADQDVLAKFDVYSIDMDGTNRRNLSQVNNFADVVGYKLNNTSITYRADDYVEGTYDLYFINLDGTGKKKLSPNSSPGFFGVSEFEMTSSNRVFFTADTYKFLTFDLFSVLP